MITSNIPININKYIKQFQASAGQMVITDGNGGLASEPKLNLTNGTAEGSLRGINTAIEDDGYRVGEDAIALGKATQANGAAAHAEGERTIASGNQSHSEGYHTEASGIYSHAENGYTIATGGASHAEGTWTVANSYSQHVQGRFNVLDVDKPDYLGTYAHIVGNGTDDDARSNAHTLDWEGNAWFAGDIYIGSNSGTNKDEGSKKVPVISYGTEDLVEGVSELPAGHIYIVVGG